MANRAATFGVMVWLAGTTPALAQTAPPVPDAGAQTPRTVDAPAVAAAQPAGTPLANGRTSYDAPYFTQYAPSTALQIVQRVPGFALEETNQDVRGFGGAAGNVVINGQRPSSKSEPLTTILSRIPANRVLRVEIGPGEAFGAEYSGKPQVLNLILTAAGGVAGTMTAQLRRDFTGQLLPAGSVSALIKRGKSSFNLSAAVVQQRTSDEGTDRITTLPSGAEVEYREKVNHYRQPNGAVSAAWSHDDGPNRTAHLNLRYAADRLRLTQVNTVFPVGGAVRDDRLFQRYDIDSYELGGDITRPLAGGGLKLIALATRRDRDLADLSLNRTPTGVVTGGSAQDVADRLEETLGRLVWSRPDLDGWTVEAGAEGVINRLRSRVDLFALGAGGVRSRIDLPVDDATVREVRGEAFINAGRPLAPALRLDLGLTYEQSRLTVRGDATAERTLAFWKPKATLDWRPTGWHVQLAVQRTVAQLRFEDFISSAELSNDRVNGGNPDLVPQRAWESLLTVERPILGDGQARLELGYNRISLVQDRVPTPDGFDAPGNLGSGTVFIARPRIDAPLDRFGFKGARLTVSVSYVQARVRDPYSGARRPFSGSSDLFADVSLRQDRGRFAWGVSANGSSDFAIYRRNEVDGFRNAIPLVTAFAEYRPDARTTITLQVGNATDAGVVRDRRFFAPDRRSAAPYLREVRVRDQHVVPVLTLKRNFG